jgi:hypothetical protein
MLILRSPTFLKRLEKLHKEAPEVAELAERIAAAIEPKCIHLDPEKLESVLLAHIDAIAWQTPSCVTYLAVWLNKLAGDELKALSHRDASAFVNKAATLGGLSGVVAC